MFNGTVWPVYASLNPTPSFHRTQFRSSCFFLITFQPLFPNSELPVTPVFSNPLFGPFPNPLFQILILLENSVHPFFSFALQTVEVGRAVALFFFK